jgi:CRP-like cAMP-binding protein
VAPATEADDSALIDSVTARLALFRGLPRKEAGAATRSARIVRARRGEWLTRRGEPMPGIFAVAEGMVKIALRAEGGAERVLRFIGAGETFGEAAVLLARPSAVDAVALTDCVVMVLPAAALRALAGRDARFSVSLARLVAERMLGLLAELESSELRPAAERLAGYLLSLAQPASGNGSTARLPTTKTLVASRLGMKKETLSRLLHDFASRHVIEVSRRDIAILDPATLAEIARR